MVWSNVGCQLNYSMERRSDAVKLGNMPGYWVQTVKFLPFKAKLDQVANPEFTVYTAKTVSKKTRKYSHY